MLTLPSMDPLTKYLSSTGWKSRDVTKSVCLQETVNLSCSPSQSLLCLSALLYGPRIRYPCRCCTESLRIRASVSLSLAVPTSPMDSGASEVAYCQLLLGIVVAGDCLEGKLG